MENRCYLRLELSLQPRKESKALNGKGTKKKSPVVVLLRPAASCCCSVQQRQLLHSKADTEASTGCNAEETNLPPLLIKIHNK